MTGSLRRGYLILYLVVQHLGAAILLTVAGVGVMRSERPGEWVWVFASPWLLVGVWWLVSIWREALRSVAWFRLEGDTLTYRHVGTYRVLTLDLSEVRKIVPYYSPARGRV